MLLVHRIILYIISFIVFWHFVSIVIRHYSYLRISNQLVLEPPQNLFILDNLLPIEVFNRLQADLDKNLDQITQGGHRTSSFIRNGSSMSHQQIHKLPPQHILSKFVYLLDSSQTLNRIRSKTGLQIQFVPLTDPNRLSIIFYIKPKDGIDWHYDGNNYYGHRWAGIYTIINSGNGGSTTSSAKFMYRDRSQEYSIDTQENSLVLFRGDKIQHRVDSIQPGEKRIVISMLFCNVCERTLNPLSHLYQGVVNQIFYGTP
jgi:hypothetical protein